MAQARSLTLLLLVPATLFAGAVDSLWLVNFQGDSHRYLNRAGDVVIDTVRSVIYVCGSIENSTPGQLGSDMGLSKYTFDGQLEWKATLGGNTWSESDMAQTVALDGDGNVYITGVTYNSSPVTRYDDYTYAKYAGDGTRLWYKKSGLFDDDAFFDMAFSASGALYMCGTRYDSTYALSAFLVARVDPSTGDTLWTRSYVLDTLARAADRRSRDVHPDVFDDYSLYDNCAIALAPTSDGVVVTGFGLDYQQELELEMWTMKFLENGTRQWATTYHNPTTIYHDDDVAFDIAVTQTGDVYIAGFDYFETGPSLQGYNFAVVRYNSVGSMLNYRSINVSAEDGDEFATAIALDDSTPQNIYVTGMLAYPMPLNDQMATFKFGPDLSYRWGPAGALYGGNSDDIAFDVAYRRGRVYCVGRRGLDLVAVGYTADNIQPKDTLWTWTYDSPAQLEDYAAAVAVKDTATIVVAGQAQQGTTPNWTGQVLTRLFYSRLDLALSRLYEPGTSVPFGDTVTPRAQVKNLGNRAVNYKVYIRIGTLYRDSVASVTRLNPGDSVDVTFRDWIATQIGSLAARCSVALGGDVNPANNFLDRTVSVRTRDATCRRIVTPLGVVGIGYVTRPLAVVANLGSDIETFDVRFRIGTDYDQTRSTTLLPGDSAVVEFPDWTASQPGTWAVTCSTRLAGDANNSNDRASGVVRVAHEDDVGVRTVVAPVGTVDSGTVQTPEAVIVNYGRQPETFDVEFAIDPFYFSSARVDDLQPGDSLSIQFEQFVADQPGSYRSVCRTLLANDENPANDTASAGLIIRGTGQPLDVGVTSIVSPGPRVDSGTTVVPQVMVRNFTSQAVEAPVHFLIHQLSCGLDAAAGIRKTTRRSDARTGRLAKRIGTDQLYHDSAVVFLNPNEEIQVDFSQWVASPAETLRLEAFTALEGDIEPANDTQVGQTIVVAPTQGHDVGATAIVAPPDTVDSGAVIQPVLRVKNFGTSVETFDVSFEMSDGYSARSQVRLAPGEITEVTFDPWQASQTGTFAKSGWTELAGDQNPANDTQIGTVTVRGSGGQVRDVGATAIVAPPDTVDSGAVIQPVLRVQNFGTTPEIFEVAFSIEDGYSARTQISLNPGQTSDVVFDPWEANHAGSFAKTGWTELAGDQNPANDTLVGSVTVRGSGGEVHDVGATAIVAPPDTVDSGAVIQPVLRVKNFGTSVETFDVSFEMSDGYSARSQVRLAPGEITEVTFDPWQASQTGTFAKSGWTELAGDQNPANDTQIGTVTVRGSGGQVRDVGATAIVAPPDTVDSGAVIQPVLRVQNFGTTPESFQATFEISDGYSAQALVVLTPGQTSDVVFDPWQANRTGVFVKRGYTELAGDQNPANDTLAGSVTVRGSGGEVHDVGVLEITAPPDTVDSGLVVRPTVRVGNFGNNSESFAVYFEMDDGYTGQTEVTVPAGMTVSVSFDEWSAQQPGTFGMRSWTDLPGDENPRNDSASGSVTVIPRSGVLELPLPEAFALTAIRPNPTTGRAAISLALPRSAAVTLAVYDASGTLVRTVARSQFSAGHHELLWDGRDAGGRPVSRGTYFVRLQTEECTALSKLTVTR
jgi:hypothetical protein